MSFFSIVGRSLLQYAYEVTPVTSVFSWAATKFIFAVAGIAYIFTSYWQKNKLVIFGLVWFLILLLPRTNIISINRPLYEHWLYLPMLGFWLVVFIIVNDLLSEVRARRMIFAGALILSVIYFGGLTIRRNYVWRNPITFYENNLKYTPNSFIQHNNLGMAYSDTGRYAEAIAQYKTAISIKDIYPQIHYNLGERFGGYRKK